MTGVTYSMKQGPASATDSRGFSLRSFTFLENEISYRVHSKPIPEPCPELDDLVLIPT
jgi:hypothetical protein